MLPGYEIIEQIYASSMTEVYRAIAPSNHRRVVIKVLTDPAPTFDRLWQFRQQYEISRQLHHPQIIETYSLEPYQNSYALVMEDFEGISLKQWLHQFNPSIESKLHIAIDLTRALHELGQHQLVHKDIKPANILINPNTEQVKLIDFSIASRLPQESPEIYQPHRLEGTLAYIAPEQTGRMNRSIDYRCDFYSLGVTLYELFTGKLPFWATDKIDWVHCHLAQVAEPADRIAPDLPTAISQIIAKLMAKNPDWRYQSALGIESDLDECLRQLQQTGGIAEFPIAQRDISDRFLIPERLYGREAEVQTLLDTFDRVATGGSEMMLVAGSSGIGKTAVINEIHKPIVQKHGYFIKGKYDQFNRNIPFSGLIQAFRELISQLLSESDARLADWKSRILTAVGKNGRVLLEVLPELELIIGSQPPVAELSGTAAQNRFNLLFQKFVRVFTTAEHPLVIFLDDLQWADVASLKTIELLLCDTAYLLLIGAYRDNEVSPVHPLLLTLQQLKQTEAIVHTLTLAALRGEDIDRLVSDTLHCQNVSTAQPLAALIQLKTQGNPFFIGQFLRSLHADGELTFNPAGYWECDLVRVKALAITDDVVAFMAAQLQKLPNTAQSILKLAACIGDRFDLDTLAIVSQQSQLNTATALWQGLSAGLVMPTSQVYQFFPEDERGGEGETGGSRDIAAGSIEITVDRQHPRLQLSVGELSVQWDLNSAPTPPLPNSPTPSHPNSPTYRFLHDRVQQAAYSLIPKHQQRYIHLQIARLLAASTPNLHQSDRLLEIVNHYNLVLDLQPDMKIDLIDELAERQHLAQLNLLAARKARASTAYAAAFNYARTGTEILGTIGWETAYQLTLSLHETLSEAAFLNGDLETVSIWTQIVLDRAQTPLDRVKTYETIMQFHLLQKQYQQAIDRGLEILQQLGIKLSPRPSKLNLVSELAKTKIALWRKSNEQLLALPAIATHHQRSLLRIFSFSIIPAFLSSPNLMVILVTTGIQLTLRYGNTPAAASFYAAYAAIMANIGDLEQSYQIGQLALTLVDRFDNLGLAAKVKATTPWFSIPWGQPLRAGIPIVEDSITTAIESGNLTSLGIGAHISLIMMIYSGISLDEIADKLPELEQFVIRSKDEFSRQLFKIGSALISNLRATSPQPFNLVASAADEIGAIGQLQDRGELVTLVSIYSGTNMIAYILEDIPVALSAADDQIPYEFGNTGITQGNIFDALTRLAAYPHSNDRVKTQLLKQVLETQRKLAKRAKLMPGNFQHKYDLVTAEKCRVLGDFPTAMELYDRAIAGAKTNKFLHEEAIANECAAKFYRAWDKEKIAAAYMQSAYSGYARWGAKAKTDDLERRYPELLQGEPSGDREYTLSGQQSAISSQLNAC